MAAYNRHGSCCCSDPNNGGGPVNIPGCTCQGTPAALSLTTSYTSGATAATYNHAYQDNTLTWFDYNSISNPGGTMPSYLDPSTWFGEGYYSDATWFDDFGQEFHYKISCSSSIYSVAQRIRSTPTTWATGTIYQWFLSNPANTCSPFALTAGTKPAGVVGDWHLDVTG
jgi:hypothetical protein